MRSSHRFTSRTGSCSVTIRKSMTTCRRSLTRCWCKSRSRRLSRARSHNIYCHVQGVYSRASWREPAASILRNRRGGHGGQLAMSVPPTTLGTPHSNVLALPEPRRAAIRLCSNQPRQQSCRHPSTPPAGCSRWTTWRIRWQPATATPESTSEWAVGARTARTCTRTCGSCCSLIRFYPASEYLGTSFGFRRLPFRRSQRAAGGGAGSGFNRHRYDDDDLCIPYSPGTLGSWSPYRNGRPPDSCFECGAAQGHFAHECPKRFVRVRGYRWAGSRTAPRILRSGMARSSLLQRGLTTAAFHRNIQSRRTTSFTSHWRKSLDLSHLRCGGPRWPDADELAKLTHHARSASGAW